MTEIRSRNKPTKSKRTRRRTSLVQTSIEDYQVKSPSTTLIKSRVRKPTSTRKTKKCSFLNTPFVDAICKFPEQSRSTHTIFQVDQQDTRTFALLRERSFEVVSNLFHKRINELSKKYTTDVSKNIKQFVTKKQNEWWELYKAHRSGVSSDFRLPIACVKRI